MNVGKYSSAGTVPSGSDLFTIKANQSLGQALDFYARKGNTILGLPYQENTIYKSADGGSTWSTISSPYYLAHIFYSSAEDKFYALELGSESVPETLHYGVSTDGTTWTWNTLYENTTSSIHYYGTFIEDADGSVAFDLLKVDATSGVTLSHIRVSTGGAESLIGNAYTFSSSADTYPNFAVDSGKTNTTLVIEKWFVVGSSQATKQVTIGSWGVETESKYNANSYTSGVKCFDNFYYSNRVSASGGLYYTTYFYSPTSRTNTYTQYTSPSRSSADLSFVKYYGFFKLGNYYYMAYQSSNATKWYRAGDIATLIDVAVSDTFNKADLTGVPVSELSLDNKHFLLSMADGKVYLCEAT